MQICWADLGEVKLRYLEAASNEGLDSTTETQLINQLLDVSQALAVNAINVANMNPQSDPSQILSATTALANGDDLRSPPTLPGERTDAADEYKIAIANAEGALP